MTSIQRPYLSAARLVPASRPRLARPAAARLVLAASLSLWAVIGAVTGILPW